MALRLVVGFAFSTTEPATHWRDAPLFKPRLRGAVSKV